MITDKFRVGVDWDGDGFINWGVSEGTPPNLIPNPMYMYQSNVLGTKISGREEPTNEPEMVVDIGALGAQYASLPCGGANSKQVWIGLRPKYYAQPLPSETYSTAGGSLGKLATLTADNTRLLADVERDPSVYGEYAYTMSLNNGGGSIGRDIGRTFGTGVNSNGVPTGTSDPSFIDFPVTAGTTYRINLYHRIRSSAGSADPSIKVAIISTDTTANIYNELTSATASLPASNTHTKVSLTFTPPVGVAKVAVRISITNTASLTSAEYFVTGLGLFPTATNPSYVADPLVDYDATEFPTQLKASTTYNYSFYTKAVSFNKVGVIVQTVDVGDTAWTVRQTEQQTTINGTDWTRVSISFTTGANPCFALLQVIPYVGVNPAAVGVTGTLYVRATQLTEGATLVPFNSGVTAGYDELTRLTLGTSWKIGKQSIEEPLPYEGTLEVNLNNNDKRYSPNNINSPLYGYFKQNRKVVLQIKNMVTGEWSNMWAGWLENFQASVGRTSDRQATITGRQGIYRFREGDFSVVVEQNKTFTDIVRNVIEAGSWRSVANAFEGIIDFNMRLDENAYITDTDAAFNLLQDGLNTYNLQGLDWGSNTTTDEALNDILRAENAGLWVDRDGLLNVVNRNYWVNRHEDYDVAIVADTEVQGADYVYGQDIVNRFEVQYQPPKFNTDEIVWSTKNPPSVKGNGRRTISMAFSFPEGRNKTVKNLQDATTFTVYSIDPTKNPTAPAVTDTKIISRVSVSVSTNGNRYYLEIVNANSEMVYVDVVVKGDYVDTGDKVIGMYEDLDSITSTLAIFKGNETSPIISTTEQAEAVAQFFVSRNATPTGEFTSLKIVDDDTSDTFDLIMALKQGNIVKIDEVQTGEVVTLVGIVEESGNISSGGGFTYNVQLCKIDPNIYAQIGEVGVSEYNGATDAYPVGIRGGKVIDVDLTFAQVIELSTGTFDSEFYFIDNPLTVRHWDSSEFSYDPTISRIVKNFRNRGIDAFIPQLNGGGTLSNIPVEIGAYYSAQIYGFATHFINGSEFALPSLVLDAEMVHPSYFGGIAWWTDVLGVRTKNAAFSTNNVIGLSDKQWGVEKRLVAEHSTPTTSPFFDMSNSLKITIIENESSSGTNPTTYSNELFGRDYVAVGGLSLVKYSNLDNMPVLDTDAHIFSLWVRTARNSQDVSYTLDILDEDHNIIVSDVNTVTKIGETKFECNIPSGYSFLTPRLRKTSANSEKRDDKLWVFGYALTQQSYDSYLDLPTPTSYVYI